MPILQSMKLRLRKVRLLAAEPMVDNAAGHLGIGLGWVKLWTRLLCFCLVNCLSG